MATPAYLTIKGSQQGLISKGALSSESVGTPWQQGREDQILVQAVHHDVFVKDGNSSHRTHGPLVITKALDKSSPLLNNALCRAEVLDLCRLNFYRLSEQGALEHYYSIELEDAVITQINFEMPNCLDPASTQLTAMERVHISYRTIRWGHERANTFAYDEWQGGQVAERVKNYRSEEAMERAIREHKEYGHIIQVTNSETGELVIKRGCSVTYEGKRWESWTDEYGEIAIKTASAESPITVHVNYEAPTGEYSDYRENAK